MPKDSEASCWDQCVHPDSFRKRPAHFRFLREKFCCRPNCLQQTGRVTTNSCETSSIFSLDCSCQSLPIGRVNNFAGGVIAALSRFLTLRMRICVPVAGKLERPLPMPSRVANAFGDEVVAKRSARKDFFRDSYQRDDLHVEVVKRHQRRHDAKPKISFFYR